MIKWLEFNISPDSSLLGKAVSKSHEVLAATPDMKTQDFAAASAWYVKNGKAYSTLYHGGLTGGYRTFMIFSPGKKAGIVLLIPCSGVSYENTLTFGINIMDILVKK